MWQINIQQKDFGWSLGIQFYFLESFPKGKGNDSWSICKSVEVKNLKVMYQVKLMD